MEDDTNVSPLIIGFGFLVYTIIVGVIASYWVYWALNAH